MPEKEKQLTTRLNNVLDEMKHLVDNLNENDISTMEGLVYHVKMRIEIVKSMRNKPGIYLTKEEVNTALESKVEYLQYAENPSRNAI